MALTPGSRKHYHIFLASPGDVAEERQAVRKFFDDYNRHSAHIWYAHFEVIDWENHGAIGVGRPQAIITRQTLEKYKDSLALVVGIMAQRFGMPSGAADSGTEEEFNWAMESHNAKGHPEIKWFFRKIDKLEMPSDPDEAEKALEQWKKVRAFRKRMEDLNDPVFFTEYVSANTFAATLGKFLNPWLADPARPWAADRAAHSIGGGPESVALPMEFDADGYQAAITKRFDKLNFEMLDTTGAFYNEVKLWSVFVPQSVRECHEYNPRLLEIPKEHQDRFLLAGEITELDLDEADRHAERRRREYFAQPLRPVLEVVEESLGTNSGRSGQKLVILGDPGAGKSSLIKYLALRWARIAEPAVRDTQPIPLMIDLREYSRWSCDGQKGFVRYLEEAPVWHSWPERLLANLLAKPGRVMLLLDGLDEIFELPKRDDVINDIQRFVSDSAHTPILLTSRVVGYRAQRLRDAEFRHFMLQDLDRNQITAFIDRWHEETFDDEEQAKPKRERLNKAVQDSKSIAMLAGNPLLLTMMAILNRHQELPRDRADLYEQASRVLLHQWDTERALAEFPGLSIGVGLREKTEILRRVASYMQADPAGLKGNMIDGATLTRLIEDYVREELNFDSARAAARAVVEQLRQRNFILCFVGADTYGFVHRTFLEYFCAADFVHQFHVTKTLNADGLMALFEKQRRQNEWSEVLRLICGQIDESFVARIIESLAAQTNLDTWDGEGSGTELVLAIECLGEARNPKKLIAAGDIILNQIIRLCYDSDAAWSLIVFLQDKILPASRGLGERWPTCVPLGERALQLADSLSVWGAVIWPEFVAIVDPNRTVIEQFLRHPNPSARASACRALAQNWQDETTREILEQLAIQDNSEYVGGTALDLLAEKWPDQKTREILTQRGLHDPDDHVRRHAFAALGKMHSGFGRILFTECLGGFLPYLDPLQPIPSDDIAEAAARVGIAPEDIPQEVQSLSNFVGWDVTRGAKHLPEVKARIRRALNGPKPSN